VPDKKKPLSGGITAYLAAFPVAVTGLLVLAVIVLRTAFEDAAWMTVLAWIAAWLAAVSPGMLLLLIPLRNALSKAAGGYIVREAVVLEGVGRETLDRCAAIAEAGSGHPIAACLRAYCGDVAAPPDKFVEMEGLGVSAQFSGQMIHAGSAEYMRGLNIEAPDVQGGTAYVALEGRLLGYYRLLDPSGTERVRTRLLRAITVCCALKVAVWAILATTGIGYLPLYVVCEALSLGVGVLAVQKL
jgi:hypothetical protein